MITIYPTILIFTIYFWRDNQPLVLPPTIQLRFHAASYIQALYGSCEYIQQPDFRHLHPNSQLYYCAPSQVNFVHHAWNLYFHCIFPFSYPFHYTPSEPFQHTNEIPPHRLVPLSPPYLTTDVNIRSRTSVPRNLNHTFKDKFPYTHSPLEVLHITSEQSSFSNYTHFRRIPSLTSLQEEWKLLSQPSEDTVTLTPQQAIQHALNLIGGLRKELEETRKFVHDNHHTSNEKQNSINQFNCTP